MSNYDFSKNERARRRKALWVTLAFHLALFASILIFSSEEVKDWKDLVPEPVKEWLDMEAEPPAATKESKRA